MLTYGCVGMAHVMLAPPHRPQIPPSIKRLSWSIRVGALEMLGGDALAVPQLRVGVIRQNFCRDLDFDSYSLGEDDFSWAIQVSVLMCLASPFSSTVFQLFPHSNCIRRGVCVVLRLRWAGRGRRRPFRCTSSTQASAKRPQALVSIKATLSLSRYTRSLHSFTAYTHSGSAYTSLLFLTDNLVKTQLDVDKQTLAFTINDSEFVLPLTGVRGPVIPAISVGNTTVCRVTIENCHHW